MALPSSPPVIPERLDIPSSPPLLALLTPSRPSQARKRPFSDYGSQSSDPIFSDATSDSDQIRLDDADRQKKKRFIRGPWWQLRYRKNRTCTPTLTKQGSFRNVDSGVWMGSDEDTITSDDKLPHGGRDQQRPDVEDVVEQDVQHSTETIPNTEALAAKFIQHCLDQGDEKVDLSDLGLSTLSNALLRPLHQLIRSPHVDRTLPPSEDEFSPLTPAMQLFLSRNFLTSLPPELFKLANITVLSLWKNELETIPSCIGRLERLKELNIAGNELSSLPFELLRLMSPSDDRQITVWPNPLVSPTDLTGPSPLSRTDGAGVRGEELGCCEDTWATYQNLRAIHLKAGSLNLRGELELRLKLGRMLRTQAMQEASRAGKEVKIGRRELIYLASSRIRYLGIDGSLVRSNTTPDLVQARHWAPCVESTDPVPGRPTSSPSLFELALRTLQADVDLRDAIPTLSVDTPPRIVAALEQAAANAEQGSNATCSTCNRSFIVPRAEWMEFWFRGFGSQDSLSREAVLPFLRKACSWACAIPTEAGEFRL